MYALKVERPGVIVEADAPPVPEPSSGEALVRVHRVGICGTDFHAFRGTHPLVTYPRILGHELGVEVLATGRGVTNVKPGDRCAVEPYLNCGRCSACQKGLSNCCQRLRVMGVHEDGGMRPQLIVPASKLHPSTSLSFDQLALVETLGIGAHAVARARVAADDTVAIIGTGPIGLSALLFAHAAGASKIVAVDKDTQRRTGAINAGAFAALAPETQPAATAEALSATLGGELPSVVIDATGHAGSMANALRLARHGGRVAYVGLTTEPIPLDDAEFHRRELTLFACRNSTAEDLRAIIRRIEARQMDPSAMVSHRASYSEAVARFTEWIAPEARCTKALIEF